jgi:hypothetical protein
MMSGEWLGSMMPPEPTRIVRVADAFHRMMLGQPEALVAVLLSGNCQPVRVFERLRDAAAFGDRRQVENGERDHGNAFNSEKLIDGNVGSTFFKPRATCPFSSGKPRFCAMFLFCSLFAGSVPLTEIG